TPFPYTTLFRSQQEGTDRPAHHEKVGAGSFEKPAAQQTESNEQGEITDENVEGGHVTVGGKGDGRKDECGVSRTGTKRRCGYSAGPFSAHASVAWGQAKRLTRYQKTATAIE